MRSLYSISLIGLFLCLFLLPVRVFSQDREKGANQAPVYYRIQPGDKLSIKFFSNPELNEPAMLVRPDGFISPQIIDELRAAGRTVAELKAELERAYNETLLTPIITVAIVEFVPPRVFVGGQVGKPGRYDLREARTLVQAIFLAGGFTNDAHRTMVVHARPDGKGDWLIRTANVLKMMDPKGTERDVALKDGDFIFVPDSKISQINKAVDAFRGILPGFF
jgi:protein involved in polysaccharide export with SLBB domain